LGSEEGSEPRPLEVEAAPHTDLVTLIDPHQDRALCLAPFLDYGLTTGDQSLHLTWAQEIVQRPEGGRVVRYRHPVLRLESCQELADPDDPHGARLTVEDYLDRLGRGVWPGRTLLGLVPGAREALSTAPRPASLDERYEIVGKVGEGSGGTVWEALD